MEWDPVLPLEMHHGVEWEPVLPLETHHGAEWERRCCPLGRITAVCCAHHGICCGMPRPQPAARKAGCSEVCREGCII